MVYISASRCTYYSDEITRSRMKFLSFILLHPSAEFTEPASPGPVPCHLQCSPCADDFPCSQIIFFFPHVIFFVLNLLCYKEDLFTFFV